MLVILNGISIPEKLGLVRYLAADRNNMRGARAPEIFLHSLRQAAINTQQDAAEQRGLQLRQNLLNYPIGPIMPSLSGARRTNEHHTLDERDDAFAPSG